MRTAAEIQALFGPLLPGTLGIVVESVSPEEVVASMVVRPELCTTGETLHGGVFMAFADTLGAVGTVANLPERTRTTTLESKTNFFSGAPVGTRLIGRSTPLHRGRSTMVWTTRIERADGKLCAVVTQTQMVLPVQGPA